MYNKIKNIVLCALITATSISCSKTESTSFWGKTEMYSDFLWKTYEPIIMERTIKLDWNEDAKKDKSEVLFEVMVMDEDGNYCQNKDIMVYKNRCICDNNIVSVAYTEKEMVLGIEFLSEMKDNTYIFGLKVIDTGNLNYIQDEDVSCNQKPIAQKFSAQKKTVMNPLKLGISWSLICLATILLCWILIVRFVTHPKTPFNKIGITYPNGEEVLVKMNNAHELICTPKKQKCSLLHGLFLGKIAYETNEYWTRPVTIKKGRTRNEIRISSAVDVVSGDLNRHSTIVICNENNEKATLEIY